MWPKMWNLGLTLSTTVWRRLSLPAFSLVKVVSMMPKGGPWVKRTSVSVGIMSHLALSSSRGTL